MTYKEHLLTILAEECNEVAQRASKALRFGLTEIQPGQALTNAERIRGEYADLVAVYDLLIREGCLTNPTSDAIGAKKEKVAKFLAYSAVICGTVDSETPAAKYVIDPKAGYPFDPRPCGIDGVNRQ